MLFSRRPAHPTQEDLSAFLDGELAPARRDAIAGHLRGCEACSVALDVLGTTKAELASLPRVAPSRSFALGPEHARTPRRPVAAPRSPWALAPAVSLTLLLALVAFDLAGAGSAGEWPAASLSANDAAKTMPQAATAERALQPPTVTTSDGAATRGAPAPAPTVANAAQNTAPSVPAASDAGAGGPAPSTTPGGDAVPSPVARSAAEAQSRSGASAPSLEGFSAGAASVPTAPTPGVSPAGAASLATAPAAAQQFSAPTAATRPRDAAPAAADATPAETTRSEERLVGIVPDRDGINWLRALQAGTLIAFVVSLIAVMRPWRRRRGEPNR